MFFPVHVNRHAKRNFNQHLFPILFEEVPNLTFISIRMMTIVICHAISQTKLEKNDEKKTITARSLSASSVQGDGYISK